MDRPGWTSVEEYQDITHLTCDGVARIAFNRPEVRNAVLPGTLFEMQEAFRHAGNEPSIGVVLLTGNGPAKDREWAWLP